MDSRILQSQGGDVCKALLELGDGNFIETVLIRSRSYYTACISSQVGCPLACVFCATGQSGFVRNLSDSEITTQIDFWNNFLAKNIVAPGFIPGKPGGGQAPALRTNKKNRVKNLVFMGMGEPFLNWGNVKSALQVINAKDGFNIGQRHISISTCGIIDKIVSFTKEDTQINLAISLHSAVNQTRSRFMPINRKYPLPKLIEVCLDYVERTGRKLFFEYTLFSGINDTNEEINQLVKLIKQHYLFHLNLILYNEIDCSSPINLGTTDDKLEPASPQRRKQIMAYLDKHRVAYTVRRSLGSDIHAACGQLIMNTKGINR